MKNQLNLLCQLQELVLTRDEHHQTGDGSHMDALDASIDALTERLEAQPRAIYERLYKKNHVVISAMTDDCCAACGMHLPISQVQQVKLAKSLQTCSSCGRILFNEDDDAPRYVGTKPGRSEPRKTGISRFSGEQLMIHDLSSDTPQGAIAELAAAMEENRFVSNADALVQAAMERESVLSTAMENNLAFPHVRGVEGGGLTLALGVSKKGIEWDPEHKVHFVFFSVIPVAVSAFYLRLMSGLGEAFAKKTNCTPLLDAKDGTALWKALVKATRMTVR